MRTRVWMTALAVALSIIAGGVWWGMQGAEPEHRGKHLKKRQAKQRGKERAKQRAKRQQTALSRKSERRHADGANTAVTLTNPATIERKGEVSADAPNILLVSIDTLRADALQPYGSPLQNAETLTSLAEEGVLFERSWAQAPSTSPTHASMFTSVYPSDHGLMGTTGRLPESWYTLAEHMQAYGVRTWASTSSVRFALGVQLQQGFDEYAVHSKGKQYEKTQKALEIALQAIESQPDRPWFGFVHLMDVHAPYSVPEPHQSKFLKMPPVIDPESTVQFLHQRRFSPQRVTNPQLRDLKAMYAGGVSLVDTRIAALKNAVQQLERPTILVITADHGEAFFEKGYLGHGLMVHEPIVRVPLIFWGPGLLPAGERRTTLAQSIDLYPTLSTLMGLPMPDGLKGADLTPVLRGEQELTGRTVVAQSKKRQMMVRDTDDGVLKVVVNQKGRKPRTYDVLADPFEANNITSTHPDLAQAWARELREMTFTKPTAQAETWEMTDEEREALEAIGYMDADD